MGVRFRTLNLITYSLSKKVYTGGAYIFISSQAVPEASSTQTTKVHTWAGHDTSRDGVRSPVITTLSRPHVESVRWAGLEDFIYPAPEMFVRMLSFEHI